MSTLNGDTVTVPSTEMALAVMREIQAGVDRARSLGVEVDYPRKVAINGLWYHFRQQPVEPSDQSSDA